MADKKHGNAGDIQKKQSLWALNKKLLGEGIDNDATKETEMPEEQEQEPDNRQSAMDIDDVGSEKAFQELSSEEQESDNAEMKEQEEQAAKDKHSTESKLVGNN